MEIFNNLPVYELQDGEVDIMSLVMFPAVEKNFMKFSKEKVKLKFDDSKRVISGVAIIAGKPIYRFNPTYGEHYVVFTPELIEKLVLKFMKEKRNDSVNLEHDKSVSGLTLIESYITSPTTRNLLFSDIPDGSWIVSYKVENKEVYEKIKSGELQGFSVEGFFEYEESEDELSSLIKNLI